VLTKLLQSCPDMRGLLRAGYLVGNTEESGGGGALAMSDQASWHLHARLNTVCLAGCVMCCNYRAAHCAECKRGQQTTGIAVCSHVFAVV
jgi:hypothetical protein